MMLLRIRRGRRGITLPDVVILIVLLPVLLLAFSCFRSSRRGDSSRMGCASNLRQIGQAILLYSNENKGAYPRTVATTLPYLEPIGGTRAAAPHPFKEGGPQENDVTAALFLLLRTQDITSEVFTCPSSDAEKDRFVGGTALNRSNFTDVTTNLSYSYQNPYPNETAIKLGFKLNNSISAEFAVASDMNPGMKGDNDNVLGVTPTSSAEQMKMANSNNHDQDGQCVLYGDGHVEFQQNPFVGVQRDNIFTARTGDKADPKTELIVASPYDANDSILLPTDD
jgi:hypothetical protein